MSAHSFVKVSDPPHLKAAFSKLGLSEIVGSKHEKQVLEMYAASGHPEVKDDETAWCAAFVGWTLDRAGLVGTRSLMARSYTRYGEECDTDEAIPRGAICVWPRGAPPSGHVNFCLHDDGTFLTCIGGNQSNGSGGGVTISRERKSRLLAARMPVYPEPVALVPKPAQKPKEPKAPTVPAAPPPPDIEPVDPPAEKPGFFRRIRNWMFGSGTGAVGFGGLTALTSWEVALIVLLAIVLLWVWVMWLFDWDKRALREWIRKRMGWED